MNTESLLGRASAGDRGAFGRLVECFDPLVRSFLAKEMQGRAVAGSEVSDLVQETFLRVQAAVETFEWQGEAAFRGWLLKVARNVVRAEQRRALAARRDVRRELRLDPSDPDSQHALGRLLESLGPSPSAELRRSERFERLRDALLTLPTDQRHVIILVRLEGRSFAEAGERLGRSEAAVSMLLVRALRALKGAFGETESLHLPERSLGLEIEPSSDSSSQ